MGEMQGALLSSYNRGILVEVEHGPARQPAVDERRVNVCVERIGHGPISMGHVRRLAGRSDRVPVGGNRTADALYRVGEGSAEWRKDGRIA